MFKQDNQYLHTSLEEVNSTLILYQKQNDLKLFNMDSTVNNLSWRVASLENHVEGLSRLEKKENLTLTLVSVKQLNSSLASPFATLLKLTPSFPSSDSIVNTSHLSFSRLKVSPLVFYCHILDLLCLFRILLSKSIHFVFFMICCCSLH